MIETKATNGHRNGHSRVTGKKEAETAPERGATVEKLEPHDTSSQAPITTEAKRLAPKAHDGFEQHVPAIFALYTENPEHLGTAIDVKANHESLALAHAKEAEKAPLDARSKQLAGEILLLNSKVWSDVLEIYGKAKKVKSLKNDERVVAFGRFMAKNRKKKQDPSGQPPSSK
jgi:hypothetical protein